MSKERRLLQVLRHYQHGAFDSDRAVERFRERIGCVKARSRSRVAWCWALASVAFVILVAGLTLRQKWMNRWEETTASVVELPDGSVARLKDGATLAYQPQRFENERTVRLSGTGCFEVKHDATSPFVACADDSYVRVLGTQFLFDADAGEVYVLEGRVLFARASSQGGTVLSKGERAVIFEGEEKPVLAVSEQPNPAAWATGRFAYDAVPLGQVLEELTAFYGKRLEVAPSTAGRHLTGEFLTSDGLEFIVSAIELALDVQISVSDE